MYEEWSIAMVPLKFSDITNRILDMSLPKFDLVIGIADGGVVPASLIAFMIKSELAIIHSDFRDNANQPLFSKPRVGEKPFIPKHIKSILLVDDVSRTGATLNAVKEKFKKYDVKTLVCKGSGDYVLFPEVEDCVKWPWKTYEKGS